MSAAIATVNVNAGNTTIDLFKNFDWASIMTHPETMIFQRYFLEIKIKYRKYPEHDLQ